MRIVKTPKGENIKSFSLLGALATVSTSVAPAINSAPTKQNIEMAHSVWISKFASFSSMYVQNSDGFWTPSEVLLENTKYTITNVGSAGDKDIFDVFAKEINKHYEILFNYDPFDKLNVTKDLIKVPLANKIIKDFEQKMITTREFHNSFIVHDGDKLTITDHGHVDFHSSWGVYNSDSDLISFNSHIPASILKDAVLQAEAGADYKDRVFYTNYNLTSLNYVPYVEVTNPPITGASLQLDTVNVNSHALNRPVEMHPSLPSGSGAGTGFWHGLGSAFIPLISIVGAPFSAGTSLGLGIIAGGLSYHNGEDGATYSPQISEFKKELLKNTITTDAPISVDLGINGTFTGAISGKANASGLFGDRSEMNLKDIYVSYNVKSTGRIYAQ